jgi:hypothetical protein
MTIRTLAKPSFMLVFAASAFWFSAPALAQKSDKANDSVISAASPKDQTDETLTKLSQDGFAAIRSVRAARLAIFNGKLDIVSEQLAKAKDSLDEAEKEAPSFSVKTDASINGKNVESDTETGKLDLIPIDATLALADDYSPTREKLAHIAKANEHFRKGQKKEAFEELRLAEVDINYTRVMMPLTSTRKHVEQAIKLAGEHKYYEANLALKAVEDGLSLDSINLLEPVGKGAAHAKKPANK